MEIREFAQRILFAGTLEEKLIPPPGGGLVDTDPGPALITPDAPGRPAGLHFSARGHRVRLPRADELHEAEARAVLLHAFANHELLAVELMALALLKFPDAPPEFRRGLLRTLREEQDHTRLYMERMAAGGLAFGDLPVNGFFWRNIADMPTPLDYVSRLSLTFEQANLDYSRYYSQVFQQMGDSDTGALLERIHRDEIAHVGYGLKWFRRWKGEEHSDWDAWEKSLPFPLSPARGKGNAPFNREGRKRAGLDADFISRMELFSHSKGRTPWVGWFNPAAEACALTGCGSHPSPPDGNDATTAALARDLDILPAFSLHSEDVVLVHRKPDESHLRRLREAGFPLPQWEVLDSQGRIDAGSPLRTRRLGRLRPWGWSADSAALLADLLPNAGEAAFASIPWDGEIRALYAKTTAVQAARELADAHGFPAETFGECAASVEETAAALGKLAAAGYARACLKAPFGIAGRGVVQVAASGLTERDLTWLRPVLATQRAVVVEPWLDRVADFSSQYELTPGEPPRLKGQLRLLNDAGGRFLGCRAGASFGRLMPGETVREMQRLDMETLYQEHLPALLLRLPGLPRLYGSLGIDAFFYRHPVDGGIRLRPLVEINPRTTMGRVTLDLRRFAAPSKVVSLRILHRRALKGMGFSSLAEQAEALTAADPPVLTVTSSGPRLTSGTLPLNDPRRAEAFLALLTVHSAPPPVTEGAWRAAPKE
ncbi:MAG: DUF455 family protein [Verrucomicrobiaceae bacterium]|nr:MAG: DUF455 family protein [Verrucomicrobiaceae bacterium]